MYQHPLQTYNKVRQTILITGSARSGTSIFGKLVGSLEAVEYFFEPPTLFSLFALLDSLPDHEARFIFDTFVYEELLIGALSGRVINLRKQDDSSIHHVKTEEEIVRRLSGVARKSEMDTSNSIVAIKVPDFVNRLPAITQVLELHKLVISVRDPGSTINSLLRRGWFTDESLLAGDITWPNRFDTRVPAPHWVPLDWIDAWDTMSEADRAALYFITQTDLPGALPETTLVFGYNQLIAQPRALLAAVADYFGLQFGPCTETILGEVKVQGTTEQFDLKRIKGDLREKVLEVYENANAQCIKL